MNDISQRVVLVVDDTETNIDILAEVIGGLCDIMVAMDGETALELVESNSPDLILLDIIMPGIDGYEVCRRIKNNQDHKHIPVIFLSALDEKEDKEKGLGLGAVDYITKPINVAEVEEKVKACLQQLGA